MLSVNFEDRHFNHRLPPACGELRVRRLAWSAVGGADTAEIEVAGGEAVFDGLANLLGCPVSVTGAAGEPVWWGYISTLSMEGEPGYALSLDDLANRVAGAYRSGADTLLTDWANDRASQMDYGIHERVVRAGEAVPEEALRLRDTLLAQASRPQLRFNWHSLARGAPRVVLHCRGWWHSLDWRTASQVATGARCEAGVSGWAALGSSVDTARLGQSFQLVELPQRLTAVWLRLRKAGTPADDVRVQLCADASGIPGTALAEVLVAAVDIPTGSGWVCASFSPGVDLSSGTPYWVVVSRVGVPDPVTHYLLEKDIAGGSGGGQMRVYGTAGWGVPTSESLLFRADSLPEAVDLLRRWAGADEGGQFLRGVRVEGSLSARSGGYAREVLTAGEALERLLRAGDSGRRLLAEVTSQRWLRVFPMPEAGALDLTTTQNGRPADHAGQPLPPYRSVAGRWVRLDQSGLPALAMLGQMDAPRVFVETCDYEAQSDRLHLHAA